MVKAERSGSCDSCMTKEACESMGGSAMLVEAENPIGASVGDRVAFTVSPSDLLKAGVVLYLVPLIGFIGGVAIGQILARSFFPEADADLLSAAIGFALLLGSYALIRFFTERSESKGPRRPRVARVIKRAG